MPTAGQDRAPVPAAGPPSRKASAASLMTLQGSAGNRAVTRILALQRKKGEATKAVLDHIFHGEEGASGQVAGYHSENEAASDATIAMVPEKAAITRGGLAGVYKASPIEPKGGGGKGGKGGKKGKSLSAKPSGSTFFPSGWDRDALESVIEGSQVVTGEYNRLGSHDGEDVPIKMAGATIYPVFVKPETEQDEEGGGAKKRRGGKGGRKG